MSKSFKMHMILMVVLSLVLSLTAFPSYAKKKSNKVSLNSSSCKLEVGKTKTVKVLKAAGKLKSLSCIMYGNSVSVSVNKAKKRFVISAKKAGEDTLKVTVKLKKKQNGKKVYTFWYDVTVKAKSSESTKDPSITVPPSSTSTPPVGPTFTVTPTKAPVTTPGIIPNTPIPTDANGNLVLNPIVGKPTKKPVRTPKPTKTPRVPVTSTTPTRSPGSTSVPTTTPTATAGPTSTPVSTLKPKVNIYWNVNGGMLTAGTALEERTIGETFKDTYICGGRPRTGLPNVDKDESVLVGWFDQNGNMITEDSVIPSTSTTYTAKYAGKAYVMAKGMLSILPVSKTGETSAMYSDMGSASALDTVSLGSLHPYDISSNGAKVHYQVVSKEQGAVSGNVPVRTDPTYSYYATENTGHFMCFVINAKACEDFVGTITSVQRKGLHVDSAEDPKVWTADSRLQGTGSSYFVLYWRLEDFIKKSTQETKIDSSESGWCGSPVVTTESTVGSVLSNTHNNCTVEVTVIGTRGSVVYEFDCNNVNMLAPSV